MNSKCDNARPDPAPYGDMGRKYGDMTLIPQELRIVSPYFGLAAIIHQLYTLLAEQVEGRVEASS